MKLLVIEYMFFILFSEVENGSYKQYQYAARLSMRIELVP